MKTLLEELNTVIPYYIFGHRMPSAEEMRRAILSASNLFTFCEEERPFQYFARKEVLKGYLLYFLPVSLNKIYFVLKEILRHPALRPNQGNVNILDLGCGITPSILAFLELYREKEFPNVHLDYTGIDMDPNALKVARDLTQTLIPPERRVNYRFLRMDLCQESNFSELKSFHPHILIMANSLGEIVSQGVPLANLSKKLGILILENNLTAVFIEPGTKKASQRLHFLRDFFTQQYRITPYSPCPHHLPCPALKNKNWCYEEWPWESPDYLHFLEPVGLQIRHLKLSYTVFTSGNYRLLETFPSHEGPVIKCTSHLIKEKSKSRLWGCMEGELRDIEKLERDYIPKDPWLTIRKGAYFSASSFIPLSGKYRLPKDASITVLYHPPCS